MTREDHVLALFAEANPVPDAEALLDDQETSARLIALEHRSAGMEDNLRSVNTTPQTPPRRGWLIGAAAAVLVLIAGFGIWALSGGDETEPPVATTVTAAPTTTATTAPSTTTTTEVDDAAAEADAFEVLLAEYEAYNSGDLEARRGAGGLADHDYYAAFAAADHRIDNIDCEPRGFGTWAGDGGELWQVEDEADGVTGYGFTCQGSGSNLFHDAGALDPAITLQWVVADGRAILMADAGNEDEWFDFYRDFRLWMAAAHPDVVNTMEFHRNNPPTDFPAAGSMAMALEYVDAFVAASPDWPRASSP